MITKLSDSWICKYHSKDKITKWVKSLKYFYFKRAAGGHANDGDEFITHIDYKNSSDLMSTLITIGIEIKEIPGNYPRPIKGKTYTAEEYSKFIPEINELKIEQPCNTILFGGKCFVYVCKGIEIRLSGGLNGNNYDVTDVDFENCKKIETGLDKVGIKPIRDAKYESNILYISERLYPNYFR